MKKTTLLFTSVLLIAIGVNLNAYSQPASRSVGQRAIPKVGRDRKIAKVVTPPEIAVIKNVVLVREWCPGHIVATKLDDGKVFVGWRIRNPAEQLVGEGTFFTTSLQKSPTVYYTQGSTQNQKAKPFSDGRVLIASNSGFVIVDDQRKIVKGQTRFDDEQITDVSVTPLSGGKTMLIAYQRLVEPRGDGRYVIVNRSGNIIHGPKIFNNKGKTNFISAATLSNGLINLAYNCSGSKTKVIDVFNNTIVGEHTFHFKLINGIESVVLDNDNILLAYIDQDLKGQCTVIQPSGLKVSGPHPLYDEKIRKIRLAKRKDGNVCVVFTTDNNRGRCAIVDTNGKVIKGPVSFYDGYAVESSSFDCVHLRDNMVMIPLSVKKLSSTDRADRMGGYIVVR